MLSKIAKPFSVAITLIGLVFIFINVDSVNLEIRIIIAISSLSVTAIVFYIDELCSNRRKNEELKKLRINRDALLKSTEQNKAMLYRYKFFWNMIGSTLAMAATVKKDVKITELQNQYLSLSEKLHEGMSFDEFN